MEMSNLGNIILAWIWNFDFHCPLPREMNKSLDMLGLVEFVSLGIGLI